MNREPIILNLTNNTYHITFHEDGTATAITEKTKMGLRVLLNLPTALKDIKGQ